MKRYKLSTPLRVLRRDSSVNIRWRTIYYANKLDKSDQRIVDTYCPEFLASLSEDYIWAVATRVGDKFFTEQEFNDQFIRYDEAIAKE